jgi:hypothetical protein
MDRSMKNTIAWLLATLWVIGGTIFIGVLLGWPMGEVGMGVLLLLVVGALPPFLPWERDEKDERLEKQLKEVEREVRP